MTDKETIKMSKFLSLILRHEPQRMELRLDEAGWVDVGTFLHAVNQNGVALSLEQLKRVVAANDKQRFVFSEDVIGRELSPCGQRRVPAAQAIKHSCAWQRPVSPLNAARSPRRGDPTHRQFTESLHCSHAFRESQSLLTSAATKYRL